MFEVSIKVYMAYMFCFVLTWIPYDWGLTSIG